MMDDDREGKGGPGERVRGSDGMACLDRRKLSLLCFDLRCPRTKVHDNSYDRLGVVTP